MLGKKTAPHKPLHFSVYFIYPLRQLENSVRGVYYTRQIFHCFEGNIPECLSRGVGKYNISGIPGNRGTNVLVYFPRSNEITVMLHFTRENACKNDPKF